MIIGDDEVLSSYSSHDENDDNIDDDVEAFVIKLYESLKESYAKNKELKIKINIC